MVDETEVDNFLEHAGVKGMKWGQRKAENKTPSKGAVRDAEIKTARKEIGAISKKYEGARKDLKTAKKANDAKGEASARKSMQKYEKEFLDSPSRPVAAKMTRGNAVAAVVIAGPIGGTLIGLGSAAVSGGIARGQRVRAGG